MPAEHGVRLDDEEQVAPCGEPPTDENPEPAVAVTEPWAWHPTLQHDQLLTQAQILDDRVRSGFRPRRDRSPRPPDHADPPPILDLPGVFHTAWHKERRWIEFLRPTGAARRTTPSCGWTPYHPRARRSFSTSFLATTSRSSRSERSSSSARRATPSSWRRVSGPWSRPCRRCGASGDAGSGPGPDPRGA
jgi:hypothetical protein